MTSHAASRYRHSAIRLLPSLDWQGLPESLTCFEEKQGTLKKEVWNSKREHYCGRASRESFRPNWINVDQCSLINVKGVLQ